MPLSPTTLSDLKRTTAHLDFLLTAPHIKLKSLPPDSHLCVICRDPFNNDAWRPGLTTAVVNRPTKLPCGHIFGLQCLAHLLFTADFPNRCPLCRAPIVHPTTTQNPSALAWKATVPLLRLLMMFGTDPHTFDKASSLELLIHGLERDGLTTTTKGKHLDRLPLLYDEFLTQFSDPSQLHSSEAERLATAEARVTELMDVITETRDLRQQIDETREARHEQDLTALRTELEEARTRTRRVDGRPGFGGGWWSRGRFWG